MKLKICLSLALPLLLCVEPCKASLVVATLSTDGLVVMADKMVNHPLRGKVEGYNKLGKVDKFTVIASTGNTTTNNPITFASGETFLGEPACFDATSTALAFFENNPTGPSIYDSSVWAPLGKYISSTFVDAFRPYPITLWPPERAEDNYCLFQTVVFHYNPRDRVFEVLQFKFRYHRQYPLALPFDDPPSPCDPYRNPQMRFGNTDVTKTLKAGSEYPDFDADGLLSSLTTSGNTGFSCEEALRAGARVITLTSLKLPESTSNPVGVMVDAMLIRPNKGTEELCSNVSTASLDAVSARILDHSKELAKKQSVLR